MGLVLRVAQKCGGVEGAHKQNALFFKELAVLLGNLKALVDELLRGNAPQADDNSGLDKRHLPAQIADAGFLLQWLRVAVLRRAAFYNVGDVHVFMAVQVNSVQKFVQKLAAAPYKGFALQIFVFARPSPTNKTGV